MNKVDFGNWVRQEREAKGWSQSDLARKAGLNRSLINNIENGVSNSTPSTLNALAGALDYPPDLLYEFLNLLPVKSDLSIIKRKLLQIAKELPDSDIETAIAMLEKRREYYKKNPQVKPAR